MEHQIKNTEKVREIARKLPYNGIVDFAESLLATREPLTAMAYVEQTVRFFDSISKSPERITNNDVIKYFNKIKYKTDKDGTMKETSQATKQLIWNSLTRFFTFAYDTGLVDTNPMKGIPKPKLREREPGRYLNMDDLNKILNGINTYVPETRENPRFAPLRVARDKLILYTLMMTGMRCTALTEINMEDIDLKNKTLTIIDKRNKKFVYPIDSKFETLLDRYNNAYWVVRPRYSNGTPALFLGDKYQRITKQAVYKIVTKYSKHALGYSVSPHKLRAAFITIYYEASGHDISATCEAVGHVNIETTNRYIRRENSARKDAVSVMERGLKI